MSDRSSPPLAPIVAALAAMIASQIIRLHQTEAAWWLAADYVGRLLSLAILFLAPTTRAAAFKREGLLVSAWQAGLWLSGLVILNILVLYRLGFELDTAFPETRLGSLPRLHGAPLLVDLTFGLTLVAIHEEIFFRRIARAILHPMLGTGTSMIIASAILVGLYHWQFGIRTITTAFIFGVFAMLSYVRMGTIMPIVVAHYLIDAMHELTHLA